MSEFMKAVVTIVTAIIGVAIIAVLVSRNANTAGVIKAGGDFLAGSLRAATGPVSGGGFGVGGGIGTLSMY